MAKLVIVNKDKPNIVVKSFQSSITKLCNVVSSYNDILFHDGVNSQPVDGDTIYKLNSFLQYELFTNNTAAIPTISTTQFINKYIKTDFEGKCIIITCN